MRLPLPVVVGAALFLVGCGGSSTVSSRAAVGGGDSLAANFGFGRLGKLSVEGPGTLAVTDGVATQYVRSCEVSIGWGNEVIETRSGLRLLGWNSEALRTQRTQMPPSEIGIPRPLPGSWKTTTLASFKGNLRQDSISSDTFTAQIRVYNARGEADDLTIQFSHHRMDLTGDSSAPMGAVHSWEWQVLEGSGTTGELLGSWNDEGNRKIYSDSQGRPVNPLPVGAYDRIRIASYEGGPALTVRLDLSAIGEGAWDTSYVVGDQQDGSQSISLRFCVVKPDGTIQGTYEDGSRRVLGRVAVFDGAGVAGPPAVGDRGRVLVSAVSE